MRKKINIILTLLFAIVLSASTVKPVSAFWDKPASFTFYDKNDGLLRSPIDGRYLAYEYKITNSSADKITIITKVDGKQVAKNDVAGTGKVDWIDMKTTKSNHTVQFFYETIPDKKIATVQMTFYSWN
jgi:hypothetical protein